MKKLFITIFLSCYTLITYAQEQSFSNTIDLITSKYDSIYSKINTGGDFLYASNQNKYLTKKYLLDLKRLHEEEKAFVGQVAFSLNGQETKNTNNFIIGTGVNFSKGVSPFEFEFNSNIQAQTDNGEFRETVSNIDISFDYNFTDNIRHESYVFVRRTANALLGIDQRYEIGGGYIFNTYRGNNDTDKKYKGIIKKGSDKLRIIDHSGELLNDGKDNVLGKNLETLAKNIDGLANPRETILNRRKEIRSGLIKKYSKFRFSMLFGLNYELEKTKDSLPLYFNNETPIKNNFDATNRFRGVLRPGININGDNFSFSSKLYVKFGLFKKINSEISEGLQVDDRVDYWSEWINSFDFQFTEKIGFRITYIFFYDNAPNRQFFNIGTATDPNYKVFEAEKRFSNIMFSFKYSL